MTGAAQGGPPGRAGRRRHGRHWLGRTRRGALFGSGPLRHGKRKVLI
jgi:hypothetical protein